MAYLIKGGIRGTQLVLPKKEVFFKDEGNEEKKRENILGGGSGIFLR